MKCFLRVLLKLIQIGFIRNAYFNLSFLLETNE